jgi:hypothetical protein
MIMIDSWADAQRPTMTAFDRADARARTAGRVHSVRRHRLSRMITLAVQYVPARPVRRPA